MVSVITPTRGRPRPGQTWIEYMDWLKQAKKSLQDQTFKDWEHIIEDRGKNTSENLNRAIARAKGEYIKLLADDDMLPPNSLQDLYDGIQGVDFVCGNAKLFGDTEMVYKSNPLSFKELLTQENTIHGGTTMYRKSVLMDVGARGEIYDEELICAEELDLHLRLLYNGFKLGYVDEIVHLNRIHNKQKQNGLITQVLRSEQKLMIIDKWL